MTQFFAHYVNREAKKFEDSQEHLLQCKSLCKNGEIIDAGTEYFHIFSEDPSKYEKITILLEQKINLREKLLRKNNSLPGEPFKKCSAILSYI